MNYEHTVMIINPHQWVISSYDHNLFILNNNTILPIFIGYPKFTHFNLHLQNIQNIQ